MEYFTSSASQPDGPETTIEDYDYEDDETPDTFHIFSMIIYSLAFLVGTVGNGLVIFFTAFKMKRTVNVVWFLNLAIADFTFTLVLPFSIVHAALNFHWPLGKLMCKLNSFVLFINLYASVFLLTIISIDRCTSVLFPVWCQNHRTAKVASFVALVVWILAFCFSLPYFIVRDIDVGEVKTTCFYNFHEEGDVAKSIQMGMTLLRLMFSFVIPFAVIVTCYAIILVRIHRNHLSTSGKPFKIILAVIVLFFVCWFPYHVFSFVELAAMYTGNDHLIDIIGKGQPLVTSLAFVNSCINPVLYVFMGRDFKTKFRRSFRSVLERAFTEETAPVSLRSKSKSTCDSQV